MELLFIMIVVAFLFGDSSSSKKKSTLVSSRRLRSREHRPIRHPWCNTSESSYHGKTSRTGKK